MPVMIKPLNLKAKVDLDVVSCLIDFHLAAGAKGEILAWMCNNATNDDTKEDVKWPQSEITGVDPLIHQAYPMSAKYFLQKRGLRARTISRAHALELTPQQKKTLDDIHESLLVWCKRLQITQVNRAQCALPKVMHDPAF